MAVVEQLRRFDRPTLILWGAEDVHFGPQWAERLYHNIPGAQRLELLPGVGHLLMEERPEQVTDLIHEFLSTVDTPDRSGS
jgi:pimeloyl-ACP methyl ester carboxylesterase